MEFDFKFIDARLGLYYVVNNRTLYCRILNDFVQDYHNFKVDFKNKTAIHTLKGLSATIGATQLHKLVEQLDLLQDTALLPIFYKELQQVINDIKENNIDVPQSKEVQETKQELSLQNQKQLFEQLQLAMIKKRPQLCESILVEIECYQLNQQQQPIFDELKQFIESYQFNEAIDLLEQL